LKSNTMNNLGTSLLDTVPLAIFVLEDRKIVIASHAVKRVFGWEPEELIGQSTMLLYPTQDVYENVGEEIYSSLASKRKVIEYECPCKRKDGSIFVCKLTASRIDAKPTSRRIVITYENINELKTIESKLFESQALYRTLAERSFTGVYVIQDGNIKYLNHHATTHLGYQPDELIGRKAHSFVHPEDRKNVRRDAREMLDGRRMSPYQYRALNKKGEIRWIVEIVTSIVYEGRPAVLGNNMDITELHEAKNRIEESNELRSSLLDAAPHAIIYVENRKIMFANHAVESVFGWRPEELIGKSTRILFCSDKDFKDIGKTAYSVLEKERIYGEYEHLFRHKDGRNILCLAKTARIGDFLNKRRVISTYEDITQQKKTMQELEIKTNNLEETNIALNVILKRREADKTTIEESVVNNVRELIMPCIQQIKKYHTNKEALKYASLAESYLTDIVSPFLHKLSVKNLRLTHKENMVANFIREGKTSKEMADLLNITVKAVDFHRYKIRLKLGIRSTKENLRSFLLALYSNDELS